MAEDWAATDKRRMLHAVYRVGDLPGTVKFYKEQFGMQVRIPYKYHRLEQQNSCYVHAELLNRPKNMQIAIICMFNEYLKR